MSETTQCRNWTGTGRFDARCYRDATGDDGLCNICRAAIKRGEERTRKSMERHEAKRKARADRKRRERAVLSAAKKWRKHPTESNAEALVAAVDELRGKATR